MLAVKLGVDNYAESYTTIGLVSSEETEKLDVQFGETDWTRPNRYLPHPLKGWVPNTGRRPYKHAD